jgi:hypothetical protein
LSSDLFSKRLDTTPTSATGYHTREFCASGWERGELLTRTYLRCRTYPRLHLAGACSTLR